MWRPLTKRLYSQTKIPNGFSPAPLPLGNPAEEQEFQSLLKQHAQKEALEQGKKHPDALDPLPSFENDVNPATGERGGPQGPEPTRYALSRLIIRYGDWERKGRVYDF